MPPNSQGMGSAAAVNRGLEAGGARYGFRDHAQQVAASRELRTAFVLFYRLAADTN